MTLSKRKKEDKCICKNTFSCYPKKEENICICENIFACYHPKKKEVGRKVRAKNLSPPPTKNLSQKKPLTKKPADDDRQWHGQCHDSKWTSNQMRQEVRKHTRNKFSFTKSTKSRAYSWWMAEIELEIDFRRKRQVFRTLLIEMRGKLSAANQRQTNQSFLSPLISLWIYLSLYKLMKIFKIYF